MGDMEGHPDSSSTQRSLSLKQLGRATFCIRRRGAAQPYSPELSECPGGSLVRYRRLAVQEIAAHRELQGVGILRVAKMEDKALLAAARCRAGIGS